MNKILQGEALAVLKTLKDQSVHCIVTSPPYFGLRDYGSDGQVGLEKTPELFVQRLVEIFREARRVLRDDGTLWLNLGDSYAANRKGGSQGKNGQRANRRFTASVIPKMGDGLKNKDLIGIPWRVAFALQADGWYLRSDIIWSKPNPMPESVIDRPTKSHEYIFLISKSPTYYYDAEAIKEPSIWYGKDKRSDKGNFRYEGKRTIDTSGKNGQQGFAVITEKRNRRSVWTITTKPYKGAHFATFPPDLVEPCILAGSPKGGVVMDPFFGSGTTGAVANKHSREYLGIEINPAYIALAEERIANVQKTLL